MPAVWAWLPGADEPIEAGVFEWAQGLGRFHYQRDYLAQSTARPLDPRQLPFSRQVKPITIPNNKGWPGVFEDAKPMGYGADQLRAQAGADLSEFDLMALGPPDGVGAIELTDQLAHKLSWRPHTWAQLQAQLEQLDAAGPASRALRNLDQNDGTSAGGERPKITLEHEGKLWLAKMQDRGDSPHVPAREYSVMTLACQVGITVPAIALKFVNDKQVYLIERFDRSGNPQKPCRHLFASAHTVLRLKPGVVRGDPRRSYLVLADEMRKWMAKSSFLEADLAQLWQRMAFNALVSNTDDHPRNHGLLHRGQEEGWRLSPAFDITPSLIYQAPVTLALATTASGSAETAPMALIGSSVYFGLEAQTAGQWLLQTAQHIASHWEALMLKNRITPSFIERQRPAFALAEQITTQPDLVHEAVHAAQIKKRRS